MRHISDDIKLYELAKLIRSKNAGPFVLTIDIMFDDVASYELVRDSHVIDRKLIAQLYGVSEDVVDFTSHDAALALKVSFPRPVISGAIRDTDVFGGQFHGPLVELAVGRRPRVTRP